MKNRSKTEMIHLIAKQQLLIEYYENLLVSSSKKIDELHIEFFSNSMPAKELAEWFNELYIAIRNIATPIDRVCKYRRRLR